MNRQEQVDHYAQIKRRINAVSAQPVALIPPRPKPPFKWTDERRECFTKLWTEGVKLEAICFEIGCSSSSATAMRRRLGLTPRSTAVPGRHLTPDEVAEFKIMWLKGRQAKVIARHFDISPKSVKERRAILKLKPRRQGRAMEDKEPRQNMRWLAPKKLHREIGRRAHANGISMSLYLTKIISYALDQERLGRLPKV